MFNLTRPCAECPFRKTGGVRLTEARAREVAGYFVNVDNRVPWTGSTFPCHKTVQDVDENDESDDARWLSAEWELCAGGVLFALKQGGMLPSIVQLARRLGQLKTDELQGRDEIVDTLDELLGLSYKRGRTA